MEVPPPARPAPARRYWVIIGASLLGLLVAVTVGPRVRSRETKRRIAARAAEHLDCPAEQVQVSLHGEITAQGCGRTIHYLRVCEEIESLDCLERIQVPKP